MRSRLALAVALVAVVGGLAACEPVPDGMVAVSAVADAGVSSPDAISTLNAGTAMTSMRVVGGTAPASGHVGFGSIADPWAVTSAILELDVTDPGSPVELWSSVTFSESSITWATRPELRNKIVKFSAKSGSVQLDVTSAVRAGHRSFTLLGTGTDTVSFATRENPNDALRPRLLLQRGAVYEMPSSIVGVATCTATMADQTAQIQRWLDSVPNNAVARFASNRCFRTEVPIVVLARTGLTIDGNGSAIESFTDGCVDQSPNNGIEYDNCLYKAPSPAVAHDWPYARSKVHIESSTNVLIRNLRVDGGFNVTGVIDVLEGQHGIRISDWNKGTVLDGIRADRVAGDYVYIQGSNDTTIQNSVFGADHGELSGNGRQGIGLTRGIGTYIRNNTFSKVTRAHIDIEPNYKTDVVRDVYVDRNTFNGPSGTTWFANGNDAITENINFRWNKLVGFQFNTLIITRVLPNPNDPSTFTRRNYSFIGNTSDFPGSSPLATLARVEGIDGLLFQGNKVRAKPLRDTSLVDAKNSRNVTVIDNDIRDGTEGGRYTNSVNVCESGNRVSWPLVADPTVISC